MNLQDPIQRRKFWLLGGLYTSQYLGIGFIFAAVPAILRQSGASLDGIAWIYALGLIWSIKFLWAPLVDRFGSKKLGHYRSWLVVLQSLLALSMVAAAFFQVPEQLSSLTLVFALISTFSATQDIAADALAVTILQPEERGLGNSIQTAGGLIGNLIGGGLVLITYQWLGWTGSMLLLAAATAIPLLTVLNHREQPAPADFRSERVGLRDLGRFFRRPGMLRWMPILLVFNVGISMAYGLINPILVDLGWALDRIGFSTNIVGSLFGIGGAVAAGWIVQRFGRKTALLLVNLFIILSIGALYIPAQGLDNLMAVYAAIGVMMIGYGAGSTCLFTMMMDKSDPSSAGTDYTLQFSLSSILSFIVSGLGLALAESMGYAAVLVLAVGATLFALVQIWFYNDFAPRQIEPHAQFSTGEAGQAVAPEVA
ncbi:MFS transporter [bacterium]|nr:MFS transporter [bacterium]